MKPYGRPRCMSLCVLLVLCFGDCGRAKSDPLVDAALTAMRAPTTVAMEAFMIPPRVSAGPMGPKELENGYEDRFRVLQVARSAFVKDLSRALGEALVHPVPKKLLRKPYGTYLPARYGLVFYGPRNKRVLTIYLDSSGTQGLIDGRRVTLRNTLTQVMLRRFSLLFQPKPHVVPVSVTPDLDPVLRSAVEAIRDEWIEDYEVFLLPQTIPDGPVSSAELERTALYQVGGRGRGRYLVNDVLDALQRSKVNRSTGPDTPADYRWGLVLLSRYRTYEPVEKGDYGIRFKRAVTMYFDATGTKALINGKPVTLNNGDVVKALERRCSPLWE